MKFLLAVLFVIMVECIFSFILGITGWAIYHFVIWVRDFIEKKREVKIMGYCSDVAIKCRPWAFNLIVKAIKKYNSIMPDDVYFNENENIYTIRWEFVKWYDDIEDVKAIMNVLKDIRHNNAYENKEYDYKFIRLGEAFEDCEILYRNDDYDIDLDIERYINTHSDYDNIRDVNIDEWFM